YQIEWSDVIPLIAISLIPVFVFLTGLMVMDSYKLIKPHLVALAILYGGAAAGICYFINPFAARVLELSGDQLSRYVAPFTEEGTKALLLFLLIARHKVGFPVDAAIAGFSIGAGFAVVENIYYLNAYGDVGLHIWFVRGFGTAVMHSSTTALLGIITLQLMNRRGFSLPLAGLAGLGAAYIVHSTFNHFPLAPTPMTLLELVVLPPIVLFVFQRSEQVTQEWLGVGFDTDQELLKQMTFHGISNSRVGDYLDSLREQFDGPVVADMLCYLRIHVEISIAAKGTLLMRKAGFNTTPDASLKAKFEELEYLKKAIGRTGLLALSPFIHTSSQDLWQIHFVKNE
ncbi:MAG: PrsW family glutamic-type intramembrane protease, partial [Rhodothermia bacterium]